MGKILAVISTVAVLGQAPLFSEIAYGISGLFALGGGSSHAGTVLKAPAAELAMSPNPFNLSVTIRTSLSGGVKLGIFDAAGRLIRSVSAETGAFVWDGRDGLGKPAVSGIYFVKATSGIRSVTGRMMLMR